MDCLNFKGELPIAEVLERAALCNDRIEIISLRKGRRSLILTS